MRSVNLLNVSCQDVVHAGLLSATADSMCGLESHNCHRLFASTAGSVFLVWLEESYLIRAKNLARTVVFLYITVVNTVWIKVS